MKKGQAAMEFLMTYGWAILVVLIIVGVIAAFMLKNPAQFLPDVCKLSGGIRCEQASLPRVVNSGQGFLISITNAAGGEIRIDELTVDQPADVAKNKLTNCGTTTSPVLMQLRSGTLTAVDSIKMGTTGVIAHPTCVAHSTNTVSGDKIDLTVQVKYTNLDTGMPGTSFGESVITTD